jgi:hypothetical protein
MTYSSIHVFSGFDFEGCEDFTAVINYSQVINIQESFFAKVCLSCSHQNRGDDAHQRNW